MILTEHTINSFKSIHALVTQGMAEFSVKSPYWIRKDVILSRYECLRAVWLKRKSIQQACNKYGFKRSTYYEIENRFLKYGVPGLFPVLDQIQQYPALEALVVMIKQARPSLSNTAIFRIAQAVPMTAEIASIDRVVSILNSYGLGHSKLTSDPEFWGKLQRILTEQNHLLTSPIKGRNISERRETFFVDGDVYQKKLELLRELFYNPKLKRAEVCVQYGINVMTYSRLKNNYLCYGPWAILLSPPRGGGSPISEETELRILLSKLRNPHFSGQNIVDALKLNYSRHIVNRVTKRWELDDKRRTPVALDEYVGQVSPTKQLAFKPPSLASEIIDAQELLRTRRVNRHFALICKKMKTHCYHICDPGALLLAPFVSNLDIVQAFEAYGPPRLRGKDISNLALLNVMRIIAGYRRISHLKNNSDRSVALASGIGMFGTTSKFYEDTIEFKFDQLHKLRCDLVARAVDLGIIEGRKLGFDFHFKEFYGSASEEKGIGKGPDKSGNMTPGFRPHIAWDLANNVIFNIAYFQGSVRSPRIIKEFCEQNIFSIINCLSVEEIYMDSEYTKEADIHYFKEITCKNGDVYICLKRNKQIKKLIKPALENEKDWKVHNDIDERKTINVILPKTSLPMKLVILRNKETKEEIRCFGSTKMDITGEAILQKYRYRWLIENGIKDLVHSYFIDETYGYDPEKVEFEFYCIMVARIAYESFLKKLGAPFFNKEDGNKYTLGSMRRLLLEKRNCTLELDVDGNIKLTVLDSSNTKLEKRIAEMYQEMMHEGTNKVLWWGNKGIIVEFKNQSDISKVSGEAP